MKLTKTKLKTIIKEEIKKVVEGFEKPGEHGLYIDLYEITNLWTGAEETVDVAGIDTSAGVKSPASLRLSKSAAPAEITLDFSDKIKVHTKDFGKPLGINHTDLEGRVFVVDYDF